MKHRTVNDYFKQQWPRLILFAAFTLGVSFFAPLKNFQLKWLIDSKSKQEALGYMGLVFAITFASWFFERLSRRSFTKIACGAVEQVRQRILEQVLHRTVAQYNAEGDAAYLSLLTTDLRTLYDDYYMSLFSIVFWGGIMLCALAMYLYISPVMLLAILLVTIPPLVLPRRMNERLKATRDAFSLQMADYTQQLKELLGGFEIIRSFLREDAYAALHQKAARKARESELDYQQSLNAMVTNTSLISNLIFPVVMLVGLFLAFDGRLTMGTVSTAASMANFVITPCHQIAQCWAKIKSSQGIRQRLEAAMAEPQAAEQGEPIGHIDSIQCETVRFAYPNTAEPVLKDASLTVDAAQKVALVGESSAANPRWPSSCSSITRITPATSSSTADRCAHWTAPPFTAGWATSPRRRISSTIPSGTTSACTKISPTNSWPTPLQRQALRTGWLPCPTGWIPSSAKTARISPAASASASASPGWPCAAMTSSLRTRSLPAWTLTPASR